MLRFLMWLLGLLFRSKPKATPVNTSNSPSSTSPSPTPNASGAATTDSAADSSEPAETPSEPVAAQPVEPPPIPAPTIPPPKRIVSLLIMPATPDGIPLDQSVQVGEATYYVSAPWEVDLEKVASAIQSGEDWLAVALGVRIPWEPLRVINSQRTLTEWRARTIALIKEEVDQLGLPWTDDYIYLGFVRGMGGFAGGVTYVSGQSPGYAMVGDICLEAICEYAHPTAGSELLGRDNWPPNSFALLGQTAAFVHEALHGLSLLHPDDWPEGSQPDWGETIMGHWWNMPTFGDNNGLTQAEIEQVLLWNPVQA